jgi:branched-chain amino acid transport system substrate-binding protein
MLRLTKVVAVLGVGALVAGACGSSKPSSSSSTTVPSASGTTVAASGTTVAGLEASAPGVSKTTIKIGLITSLTGSASSEYTNLPKAAQAGIDAVNAAGGVDGRQLQLVTCDDASAASSALTCAQSLVAKGVFAIEEQSAFVFGAYKYLNQLGIPVTGGGYDGPEWGLQPNTNMFSVAGSYYTSGAWYTQPAQFMKQQGVASVSSFGYGISPSSSDSAKGFSLAAKSVGLTVGYLNTSLPFGTVNVTAVALALKASGVTGAYMAMDEDTNFAILTGAKQAGVNLKVAVSATGYGQDLLNDSSALQSGQGDYFPPVATPVELKTPATLAMQAAFQKYAGFSGVPGFDWYEGWLSTDLMIEGLKVAGTNPTRSSFIHNLQQVTNYTAEGLLSTPVNFSLAQFGKPPQQECSWLTQLEGNNFVVANNGKPLCGTLLPNTYKP